MPAITRWYSAVGYMNGNEDALECDRPPLVAFDDADRREEAVALMAGGVD